MSQAGRYEEDKDTGKVTLVERTEAAPQRTEPRKPGEPVHVDPRAVASATNAPAAAEATAVDAGQPVDAQAKPAAKTKTKE